MTTITSPAGRLRWTLADGLTLIGRELSRLRQEPGQIIAALLFPIIMVVLFGYVFGSAIQVPGGGDYRAFLMPGLFAMVTFTSVQGVMGRMAADASLGVMDRFRSMPMARLAVPFGHTGADSVVGVPLLAAMAGTGLLVGWQPHRGLLHTVEAFLLLMLMRYALSWVGVYVGLVAKNEQMVTGPPQRRIGSPVEDGDTTVMRARALVVGGVGVGAVVAERCGTAARSAGAAGRSPGRGAGRPTG
ncbi:ABC transporter permease [Streptomyces antimycoticus]